ncbi:barstar family protein [Candidatus Gracilibacteria bacterium]|nr:barstar family protein [Candidatus Gracilibacteria bacterium]
MIAKIHINLTELVDRQSLFELFVSTFSFPAYFGYNWDALSDMMSSLDPAADIFQHMGSPLTGVHLIFEGFDVFESHFPESDLDQFRALLIDLSLGRDFRSDHLSFTFELRYSP